MLGYPEDESQQRVLDSVLGLRRALQHPLVPVEAVYRRLLLQAQTDLTFAFFGGRRTLRNVAPSSSRSLRT